MDLGMTWWLMLIAAKTAPSKLFILLGSGKNSYYSVGVLAKMWASSHEAQR